MHARHCQIEIEEYMMNQRSVFLIASSIAVIFMVSGIAMIFVGWNLYSEQQKLLSWGIEAEGQIIGFQRLKVEHENRLRDNFVPIVEFRLESGKMVTFMGAVAERFWSNYQMGKAVIVVYDPGFPEDARINELAEIWFAPAMLFLIGLGAALILPYTVWKYYSKGD